MIHLYLGWGLTVCGQELSDNVVIYGTGDNFGPDTQPADCCRECAEMTFHPMLDTWPVIVSF